MPVSLRMDVPGGQPHNLVGILLFCSCLVALVSAQCEAEIAACAADGTCSTCRHFGTRCTVPDSDQSAWSADLDSDGGCGEPDLWDYGGLNHDGSMPPFDSNGAPGQQVSTNCEHSRALYVSVCPGTTCDAPYAVLC